MSPTSDTSTEESSDRSTDRSDFERRPLLKALGAGTALTMGSGLSAARIDQQDDDEGEDDEGEDDEGEDDEGEDDDEGEAAVIDPVYGFPTPDAGDVPGNISPDHDVELHTSLPADAEDPDRPPLFHFEPSGLHVDPGDVVQFTLQAPDHTVTAYHPGVGFQRRVPEGVPAFSAPVLNVGGAWLYRFDEPGLYDMYCGPHHVLGMNMRVVVGELGEEDVPDYEDTFEGSEDPPLLAPFSREMLEHELNAPSEENEDCEWTFLTPQEVLDAPSLDPSTIQEQGAVPFEAVLGDLDRFPDDLHGDDEAAATVQVREHDDHGPILVDSEGMTLYMFVSDGGVEDESTCHGACAETWPPLTVEDDPVAGEGVETELGTFERAEGTTQVTASNWPLYHFADDEQPGDATGQGVNGAWWVLDPNGAPIRSE